MNSISVLAAAQSSGGLFSILILVLPLGALFYLMIVPQRKQRQKHATFVSSLDVGDEVVTSGGMFGRITYLEDGIAHIEVDTDVVVRVTVSSISRSASDPEPQPRGGGRGVSSIGSKPEVVESTASDSTDDAGTTEKGK